MFRSWKWMGWLFLCLGGTTLAEAQVFPADMKFRVKSGLVQGSFDLEFVAEVGSPRYAIKLSGFGGLGLTSDQQLWSYLLREDLSLYGHVVLDGGEKIRQVFLEDDCESALGQVKTTCFVYKERASGDQTQTEIFAPYPAVDLLSSLVVASRHAADGKTAHFNFIFNDTTKQVTLAPDGREQLKLPGGKSFDTAIWRLTLKDTDFELYRFYIAKDRSGHFPAKMVFVDEDKGPIEFIAQEWTW